MPFLPSLCCMHGPWPLQVALTSSCRWPRAPNTAGQIQLGLARGGGKRDTGLCLPRLLYSQTSLPAPAAGLTFPTGAPALPAAEGGALAVRAVPPPRPPAADLDEDLQVLQVFAIPLVKRLQELQALAGGAHIYSLPAAVLGRVLVGVLPRVELLQEEIGTC